jgi:release factor glutamine methyltransferase
MRTKINLRAWQEAAIKQLENSDTPGLESQLLLAEVMGHPREWVISHFENELTTEQNNQLNALLTRLIAGEPLAYITGRKAFFGLDFVVSKDVLIPRPETELLVEEAIQWLTANPSKRTAVDVGTGSGIIAITLADAIPDLKITAVDISPAALEIARKNCEHFQHEDQITFLQNDLLDGVQQKFDLITANLPYIPTDTLNGLNSLRYEPRMALDGGNDGTLFIGQLLNQAVTNLNPGGLILLEIEATISEIVNKQVKNHIPSARIEVVFDYANNPRIVKIHR